MESITLFFTVFAIVFVGELGDKTQIAAGSGALANKNQKKMIFLGSAGALTLVAGLTTFMTNLIPQNWMLPITKIGGLLLIAYAFYLYYQIRESKEDEEVTTINKRGWVLLTSQFVLVFLSELGDKTQFATFGLALENQDKLFLVFIASASALICVTAITVIGVSFIPKGWVKGVQILGATSLLFYGCYMLF